ncbi:hypothetical protein A3715_18265 [Oleiphilus sp. HI0009]|nr:hypothetical protein A3715_37840 [Oleiphilus sp. HI0009]KZX83297.1 hypothetical protein A3715_18265 [Oleiphilus sp. HI0009]
MGLLKNIVIWFMVVYHVKTDSVRWVDGMAFMKVKLFKNKNLCLMLSEEQFEIEREFSLFWLDAITNLMALAGAVTLFIQAVKAINW